MPVSPSTPRSDPAFEETRDAIAWYSVNRHSQTDLAGETIVLCPLISVGHADPDLASSLKEGYAEARRQLTLGKKVRLIAHGSTLKNSQPDWVDNFPDFSRTEVGAYRHGNPIEQTRALAASVRAWLDRNFAPAVGSHIASDIFYGSAAGRIFQPLFDAIPYAKGLAAAHPNAEFIVTDPMWPGVNLLNQLLGQDGNMISPPPSKKPGRWRLRFSIAVLIFLLRAMAGQFKNYFQSVKSRRFLAKHSKVTSANPAIWLALVPDWERTNSHVIDRIARPLLQQNISFGIFLVSTLSPGERFDSKRSPANDWATPWSILDQFKDQLDQIPVVQLVRPLSPIRLLNALVVGGFASLRIAWKLLRDGAYPDLAFYGFDLRSLERPLAAMATIDVLQVTAVNHAFAEAFADEDFTGRKVFFSNVGLVETMAADRQLHQAGAITVNFSHGAMNDTWYGASENRSDHLIAWTSSDIENCHSLGTPAIYFPPVLPVHTNRHRKQSRNILLLTSYLHHDWAAANFPYRPFLTEVLRCQTLIEAEYPGKFHFRLRTHPSDVASQVDSLIDEFPDIQLSSSASLAEDLKWADIAIASPSTVILFTIAAEIPIFVHCAPAYRNMPEMRAVDSRRKFFRAEDILPLFTQTINGLANDRDKELEPERSLRELLIGSDGAETDILSIIGGLQT